MFDGDSPPSQRISMPIRRALRRLAPALVAVWSGAALTTALPARAAAQPTMLARGGAVEYEYLSTAFGELVARSRWTLDATGTILTATVTVVPARTFLQYVYLAASPVPQVRSLSFTGYRDVSVTPSPAGYTFGYAFGGDPGLSDAATVTAVLDVALTEGLAIDRSAVQVYGFRGNTVPNDLVVGRVAVVPEPTSMALVGSGVLLLTAARVGRRRRGVRAS
jgi:hypothetical protein